MRKPSSSIAVKPSDRIPSMQHEPASWWVLVLKSGPDLITAGLAALWLLMEQSRSARGMEAFMMIAFLEGATLMGSCTLIDLASRLAKPPSWWFGLILAGLPVLVFPHVLSAIPVLFQQGFWVALPFAVSVFERIAELWTLPKASALVKIRRRVLTFDRLYIGLVLAGSVVAVALFMAIKNEGGLPFGFDQMALPWLLLAYFCLTAFNIWRVHQAAFAARPRSLLPWIDQNSGTDLSPL